MFYLMKLDILLSLLEGCLSPRDISPLSNAVVGYYGNAGKDSYDYYDD